MAIPQAVEALGPGVATTVGVGPQADSLASAAPAALIGILMPLSLATPARDKPLVVVVSAHVLDTSPVVHTISRGYNCVERSAIQTTYLCAIPSSPLTEVFR